jgi:hypothetical protein
MFRRNRFFATTLSVAAISAMTTACGGGGAPGSPSSANTPHPMVRQFSPTMSPIDLNTGQANPTYTDPFLNVGTDPAYPGKIVVFFQADTRIDPASVFIGGNPALGIDLSALQILQYLGPSTGNVPLQPAPNGVQVLDDRIIFTPATLPLPLGQYSVGVFANLKSIEGDAVQQAPVFHSFTVGTVDNLQPVVVTTSPGNGQQNVGAGVPPPPPPANIPASSIADVRTTIFGLTTPDIIIRFNESIESSSVSSNTVQVVDAGAFVPGGGNPPPVLPAPGFPKLKSALDQASMPSNGHEIVWRADPAFGGLPFGTQVQVTLIGQRDPPTTPGGPPGPIVRTSAIKDRSGNLLDVNYVFKFQTIAPPDLPACPEPEYGIYWSASDRVGVIDTINFKEIAATILGTQTTPITRNTLPERNDKIANKTNLGLSFDPLEISVDTRTDGVSCHSFAYVQSFQSGQVVILNTRTMLPVAIINTPSPGGLSNQTGFGTSANVLLVTNSSANTLTTFDMNNVTPGRQFLNGPIFIAGVAPTGNTPRAVSISAPPGAPTVPGSYNREGLLSGPGTALVMYADFTDGVVNTTNLGSKVPVRQFTLGTGSSPNDISMTPCFGLNPLLFAAISQGGAPGDGKVAYYVAGPGCLTGTTSAIRPDSLVGDLSGFDAPAGLDDAFPYTPEQFFVMAESGSTANRIVTLGVQFGTFSPRILRTFQTAANPTSIAHRPSYFTPGINTICGFPVGSPAPSPPCFSHAIVFTPPPCQYHGAEIYPLGANSIDTSGDPAFTLYVCARGAGRVDVMDVNSGSIDFYSPVSIPGVRYVGSTNSQ